MTAVTSHTGGLNEPARQLLTIWQANADVAAHRPEAYAAAERHDAVRQAVAHLTAGRPGRAQFVLARSVMRQARILGVGHTDIGPTCPCGGRCPAGHIGGAA